MIGFKQAAISLIAFVILVSYGHYYTDSHSNNLINIQKIQAFTQFQNWIIKFGKTYKTEQQKVFRFQKFYQNYKFIEMHNERFHRKQQTFEVGLNHFADLDNYQFNQMYIPQNNNKVSVTQECKGTLKIQDQLPYDEDWSPRAVTPVKYQGVCTAAWAFAATGALQGLVSLVKGVQYNFSAQQLIDCSLEYGNQGCNGGQIQNSFWYTIDKGITTLQQYPYVAQQQACSTAFVKVFQPSQCARVKPLSTKALQSALVDQPVAVYVDSSSLAFQLYRRGIFSGKCGTNANHAMVLIGYGALDQQNYWKLKNSWGLNWGQQGYIFISRDIKQEGVQGQCGILIKSFVPLE